MTRALLVTGHFAQQKRKGSMLWLAEALQDMGWHVTIATVGYSWLSRWRRDPRLTTLESDPIEGKHDLSPSLTSLFRYTPLHPINTRHPLLDPFIGLSQNAAFIAPWRGWITEAARHANLVILESGPPVLFTRMMRHAAPQATLIYRVNDDICLLGAPKWLVKAEEFHAHQAHRISTSSPTLAQRFSTHSNVTLDPMGVPQELLQGPHRDPFGKRAAREVVCAGTSQIDLASLTTLATQKPDWRFHIMGRLKTAPPSRPNLVWHGEMAFAEMIPWIAHADIGLAAYRDAPGISYQAHHSNRIMLYRHFGLPTLAPQSLCDADPGFFSYTQLDAAAEGSRTPQHVPDWHDFAQRLVQNVDTDPPLDVSTSPATVT